MLNFIVSGKTGVITMVLGGKARTIGEDHPNYKMVCAALKANDQDLLLTLLDQPVILNGAATFNDDGTVSLNGKVLSSVIAGRIVELSRKGLPVDPMLRFIENCARNPSDKSVEELFEFLENKGIPITEDGCFLCYKAVRSDFMDKYAGKFHNGVGTIVKMDRTEVDPNRDRQCSFGLHVGALDYVSNYGAGRTDIWLLVKVNPQHAVAVPRDHNAQKMRVSEYFVVQVLEKTMDSQKNAPCYSSDGAEIIEADGAECEVDDDGWDDWEPESRAPGDACDDPECDICEREDCDECDDNGNNWSCEFDREEEEAEFKALQAEQVRQMEILEKEVEKFVARHTRDSAVARADRLGLIPSKSIGRDIGKEACCRLLAAHKLNQQ